LPPLLLPLLGIAYNLRWSWDHGAVEVFRRLDRDLWETSGRNPVLLLGSVDQAALEAAASDDSFLAHMRGVADSLDLYVSGEGSWYRREHGKDELLAAYFSAEFGITECLSIFAGGLGILAGDHLKAASDLGLPLVGVGLLYQQGYFRQFLNGAGWQQEDVRTAAGMLLVAKGTQINYALLARLRNFLRRSTISGTVLVRFCSPFNQAFVIRALEWWVVALVVAC